MQAQATLPAPQRRFVDWGVAAAAGAALAAAGFGLQALGVLALICAALVGVVSHRFVLRWEVQVSVICLVILLIPLGRYELPGNLPFGLEPYRLVVALVAAGWLASLASDREMQWQKAGLFGPLFLLFLGIALSDGFNTGRIEKYGILPDVTKTLSLFTSYVAVLLIVTSVIRRREQLERVVQVLVAGGGVLAFFSLLQYWTSYNIFDHLNVIPLLQYKEGGLVSGLEA